MFTEENDGFIVTVQGFTEKVRRAPDAPLLLTHQPATTPTESISFRPSMKTIANTLLIALTLVTSLINVSQARPIDGPGKPVATYATSFYPAIDGRLVLSLTKTVGQPVSIRLNQANGVTLFTQQVTKRQTKAQVRFDVSELPDGAYTVEVSNGTQVITHQVRLDSPQFISRQIAAK
jgi:hypothetical protein